VKIGIVTIYNGFNYGSILQAIAMQQILSKLGHQVEFVNVKDFNYLKKEYKVLLSKNFLQTIFNLRQAGNYLSAVQELKIAETVNSRSRARYDLALIGSDEVWSLRNPRFHNAPEFFGIGLNADATIGYGVSCGQTSYEEISSHPELIESIRNMNTILARDDNTIEVVRRVTGTPAEKVVDPAFLADFSHYIDPPDYSNFILVYGYRFSPSQIDAIVKFARKRRKTLLAVGFLHHWCDQSLRLTIGKFLGLLKSADFVVTNTFHGTVFSIIFRKAFGVYTEGKIKVKDVLDEFGMSEYRLDELDDIEPILSTAYDKERLGHTIAEHCDSSLSHLKAALESANR
jgi:hypothetical protein